MTLEYGPKDVCWYYDEDGNGDAFTDLGKTAKLDGKTEMSDGYKGTFWKMETSRSTIQHGHLIQQILIQRLARLITYKRWSSFNSAAGSEIEQDWRDHNNCELFDDYFKNVNLHIAPGTMYSAGVFG